MRSHPQIPSNNATSAQTLNFHHSLPPRKHGIGVHSECRRSKTRNKGVGPLGAHSFIHSSKSPTHSVRAPGGGARAWFFHCSTGAMEGSATARNNCRRGNPLLVKKKNISSNTMNDGETTLGKRTRTQPASGSSTGIHACCRAFESAHHSRDLEW